MVLHRLMKLFSVILFAESVKSRGGINIWQHCYQIVDTTSMDLVDGFPLFSEIIECVILFDEAKRSEKMIKLNSFKT